MVTRLLLAVVVAAVLLAVSAPAVETARADRTAAALDRTADRVEHAGASLVAADEPDAGARRVVTVSLPRATLTAAGVDRFVVACREGCSVRYRLRRGREVVHHLRSAPFATPEGPVAFSTPGPHRLLLGLARKDDRRVVTVRG
ncbi:MAG: hypothetical protein ABEH90_03165 [Halolamina sp.]